MTNQKPLIGLGVYADEFSVYLYYRNNLKSYDLAVDKSSDGFSFSKNIVFSSIRNPNKRKIGINKIINFRIADLNGEYYLTYLQSLGKKQSLFGATSKDLYNWHKIDKVDLLSEIGMAVPKFCYQDNFVLYYGGDSIYSAYTPDLKKWQISSKPLIKKSENQKIEIGNIALTNEGILIIYYLKSTDNTGYHYALKTALFDKKNPQKLIWETEKPVWEQPENWHYKELTPIGLVDFQKRLISYWNSENEGIFAFAHPPVMHALSLKVHFPQILIKRIKDNPILKPIVKNFWESKAVFNPAAFYEEGKVHIIYRAIGDRDVSVLGYATSPDGINIDNRHPEPIYVPTEPFEGGVPHNLGDYLSPYASGGGGYGGCEDPRIVKIEDKLYMTYVAHDGSSPPRVALTSISVEDFLNHNWKWKKPVLISPPGVVDKNACILPEKIKGKYLIFHRIYPDILIDEFEDLDFDGQTKWLGIKYRIKPRPNHWDSRKIGIGAPPIKTKDGWLIIYQAVGNQDSGRYKVGAMLLDLEDPTRVNYRSEYPILEPVERYENEGFKAGVVYPCGSVILKDNLFIYYGGADMFVCAAQANLSTFLHQLKYTGSAKLEPIQISFQIN